MASGQVDLALGLLPQLQAGFFQQVLFHQPYVCLMRNGHALAARGASSGTLSLADFKAADHVQVESAGTGHSRVDEALQRHGLIRRIRLTLPHFVALGQVLSSTDLIATVPERYAQRAVQPFGLTMRHLPIALPESAIHQFWHARLHRDPGCQWLRSLVAITFGAEGS
jgi:DNA-binding transcriptional LysR family regulator